MCERAHVIRPLRDEKKYVNDELIEIAREALDNDGIVYGFNHYLKDKATKELYVIQTWDYVPDIRMIKTRLLRRKQREESEKWEIKEK